MFDKSWVITAFAVSLSIAPISGHLQEFSNDQNALPTTEYEVGNVDDRSTEMSSEVAPTGIGGSGYRYIINMGCHINDNTCYVYVSGAAVGPSTSCTSTSIRWNRGASPNGESTLELLKSALISHKLVNFEISSYCYPLQNNYPTFDWIQVNY